MRHRRWNALRAVPLCRLAGLSLGLALSVTALPGRAAVQEWADYRAKGEIQVSIQDVNMSILVDQIFRRPSTMLLNLDLLGLKQHILMDGNVEQSYNPAQGLLIETRYLNLEKSPVNPMVGAQLCLEELGKRIREAKSVKEAGKETLLGFECDILQVDTKEILQRLSPNSLLNNGKLADSLGSTVKAWVSRDYGILVKVEIPSSDGKPALTVNFTELKVNTGVVKDDLKLDVPRSTRRVSVTSDLSDPDWDAKLRANLRKAVDEKTKPADKGTGKSGKN